MYKVRKSESKLWEIHYKLPLQQMVITTLLLGLHKECNTNIYIAPFQGKFCPRTSNPTQMHHQTKWNLKGNSSRVPVPFVTAERPVKSFLLNLHILLPVHFAAKGGRYRLYANQWEDQAVRKRTVHPPEWVKVKKVQLLLTPYNQGCLAKLALSFISSQVSKS